MFLKDESPSEISKDTINPFDKLPKVLLKEMILKRLSLKDQIHFSMTSKKNYQITQSLKFFDKNNSDQLTFEQVKNYGDARYKANRSVPVELLGPMGCGGMGVLGIGIAGGIQMGNIFFGMGISIFGLVMCCTSCALGVNNSKKLTKLKKMPQPLEMYYEDMPESVKRNPFLF